MGRKHDHRLERGAQPPQFGRCLNGRSLGYATRKRTFSFPPTTALGQLMQGLASNIKGKLILPAGSLGDKPEARH
jgi:hypothetical protein